MVPWLLLEYLGQVACSLLSFTFCFPCWLLHTHCWHLTVLAPFCWWHHQWLPVLVTLCYKSPTIIVSSYHISSNHSLSFTHNVRNENHLEGNVCLLQQFFFLRAVQLCLRNHMILMQHQLKQARSWPPIGKGASKCPLTGSVVVEFCSSLKWSDKWVTPCINVIGMAVLVADVVPAGTLCLFPLPCLHC